jgi:hypothetical protein
MRKQIKNVLLAIAVFFISYLLIFEVAVRLALKPTEDSYGTLFGIELPPFDLPAQSEPPEIRDRSEWYEELIVDGKKITVGDLWGYYRRDLLLGYAPMENTTSLNGWWQSNNIGAMAKHEVTESKENEPYRILVFGDSFASGSRVPQEMAWPNIVDSMNDNIEVINFAWMVIV